MSESQSFENPETEVQDMTDAELMACAVNDESKATRRRAIQLIASRAHIEGIKSGSQCAEAGMKSAFAAMGF